jgi:hypothetical protein
MKKKNVTVQKYVVEYHKLGAIEIEVKIWGH